MISEYNQAIIIVGANYGDEGKGATTHEFTKDWEKPPIVVRFNGGAQAGHTVQLADGRRRIFSSLGSGTFNGCPTFLSKHFLFDPAAFVNEYRHYVSTLKFPEVPPQVYIDPRAWVVTPWDKYANQEEERDVRHGSCGMGIGATVGRNLSGRAGLRVSDLLKPWLCVQKLRDICGYYYEGFKDPLQREPQFYEALTWLSENSRVLQHALPCDLPEDRGLVFEGAQGLLLDENDKEHFPHVTWSTTGVRNALQVLSELKAYRTELCLVEVVYCTRPYLTRHGNGPMHAIAAGKGPVSPANLGLVNFEDATNVPNEWQGSLRFGELDMPKLWERIAKDVYPAIAHERIANIVTLAISCYDHLPEAAETLRKSAKGCANIEVIDGRAG